MALTEIEYGSLASSQVMNNNFRYLDNRISNLSQTVSGNQAGVNSNIASINSLISNMNEELSGELNTVSTSLNNVISNISQSGMYVTTYVNGSSWYREYFSDAEKTTRVWLEQGGVTIYGGSSRQELLKSFSDTNYTVTAVKSPMGNAALISIEVKEVSAFYTGALYYNGTGAPVQACSWYACGV